MEKRGSWLKVRILPDEKKALKELADSHGMTLSDFVRDKIGSIADQVGRQPKDSKPVRRADPMLLANIGRVGSNLNQIARWANQFKSAADAATILAALVAIEQALLSKVPYRRKPKVGEADHVG